MTQSRNGTLICSPLAERAENQAAGLKQPTCRPWGDIFRISARVRTRNGAIRKPVTKARAKSLHWESFPELGLFAEIANDCANADTSPDNRAVAPIPKGSFAEAVLVPHGVDMDSDFD